MIKILFICLGNICRSPMAEFIFKKMAAEEGLSYKLHIASAAVSTEEIGNDIYPPAKRELERQGVPYERRGARQITYKDFEHYDIIIGMDSSNMRSLRRMAADRTDGNGVPYLSKLHLMMEYAGRNDDVADPWYTGDFYRTYCDIVEGCRGLLDECRK